MSRLPGNKGAALRHPVVRGFAGLAGVQMVQLLVPLVTLPYLTRVLGPARWGEVAAALALGSLASTLPEFGFSVSASRTLARLPRHPPPAAFVTGVVAAKALLAFWAVALVLAVQRVPAAALADGRLVLGAALVAAANGLWMAWYFEGREAAPAFFRVVVVARLLYVGLLVALVRSAADGARVPLLFGLSSALAALLALRLMPLTRHVRPAAVGRVLREGLPGFLQRLFVMAYFAGNVFWMSLVTTPREVGGYGVAEQAVRGACFLLLPAIRALYPHYSRVGGGGARAAWMRFTLPAMAGAGALISLAVFALAGLLPLAFGADFAPFVPVVRWLSPLPLLGALSQYWTVQGLMAHGRDRAVAALYALGALVDVGLAFALVPRGGATGMAIALLAAETTVTAGSALLARWLSRPSDP